MGWEGGWGGRVGRALEDRWGGRIGGVGGWVGWEDRWSGRVGGVGGWVGWEGGGGMSS